MGKEQCKGNGWKTFVLMVDMHCQCNGCVKKINDGIKDISLAEGVEKVELMMEKGEVKVVGRVDSEKLRRRLRAVTNKCVKIEIQSNASGAAYSVPQQPQNRFTQAPSNSADLDTPRSPSGWQNGLGALSVMPSAPPLPQMWSHTIPSERCAYRWSAAESALGMWTASDVTGTLAIYEL